jgi:hypothetical protein
VWACGRVGEARLAAHCNQKRRAGRRSNEPGRCLPRSTPQESNNHLDWAPGQASARQLNFTTSSPAREPQIHHRCPPANNPPHPALSASANATGLSVTSVRLTPDSLPLIALRPAPSPRLACPGCFVIDPSPSPPPPAPWIPTRHIAPNQSLLWPLRAARASPFVHLTQSQQPPPTSQC